MARKLILKEILGSKIYFLDGDGGISKRCLSVESGLREEAATQTTIDILKSDDICIDIGANLGYYALLEAKIVGDKGFVYAVEPVKENTEALKKSIALNGYKNIKVFEGAIGNKTGKDILHQSSYSNQGTMLKNHRPLKFIGDIEVNVFTLDYFCDQMGIERINFIRMDVEAYEAEVIKGMQEAVKLMPKEAILCIEIHAKAFLPIKLQPPKGTFKFDISKARPLLDMLDTLNNYGFIPKKYCLKHHPIIDINNWENLKTMLAEGHCPQIFFEMNKDWKKL